MTTCTICTLMNGPIWWMVKNQSAICSEVTLEKAATTPLPKRIKKQKPLVTQVPVGINHYFTLPFMGN